MRNQGRPFRGKLLAFQAFMILLLLAGDRVAAAARWPLEMRDDAELTNVFFVDSDLGWAVGDRGVIWHTEDGGRHWQLQRSPVTCRLESIFFLSAQRGWIVGGKLHPYTRQTTGVVLSTRDGGRTWTQIGSLTLPWLKRVQFIDLSHGWAVGHWSTMYPTGIFRTDDGGRSWTPLPAGKRGTWLTADFRSMTRGVAAGQDGQLAVVAAPKVSPSKTPPMGRRPLRSIRMVTDTEGWLVGDSGLVLKTHDAGMTWQTPPGQLPPGVSELFDFHAFSVFQNHVWVAGSPGSRILHSPDRGATWELLSTDQNIPLTSIVFSGAERGWAVGALGTILATRDGGRSWRRQRTGGTRLALLALFSEPTRLPLELFALQSGNEGYLAFAELLSRRDVETSKADLPPLEDLGHGAMTAVGACGADQAWQFPLRQAGLHFSSQAILEGWNRANDGKALSLLEERVVRKIRQWRPEVIVTEPPSPMGRHPLSNVINQVVLTAAERAADPTIYPDHMTVAGLQPWAVKKVFSLAEDAQQATVTLTTAQLATRLGRSVADQASDGYAMLRSRYQPIPLRVGFQLLVNKLPQSVGRKDIFSGIFLQAGGEARRQLGTSSTRDIPALTRAAQKQRNLQQLIDKSGSDTLNAASWLGQVQQLTKGLAPSSGGQVLYQLAQRYRDTGRTELAARTLEQLVERFPDHALTDSALVWLVQYYCSREITWQLQRHTHLESQAVKATLIQKSTAGSVRQAKYDRPAVNDVRSAFNAHGTTTTAGAEIGQDDRAAHALALGKLIQRTRPQLFAEPRVQFPMSVAYRTRGMPRDAERFYHRLSALPDRQAWSACAATELWLSHGRGKAPKPVYTCHRAPSRPRLDGQLNDDAWKNATILELKSPYHDDDDWPGAAMLTWDNQFLFLAISCRKAPGHPYQKTPGPRPRDPDLSDHDRVDVLIDVNRDYVTFYRLTVDHRGWTGEACAGNGQWNPTWYVAAAETKEEWTVEAAIALSELVRQPPDRKEVWAFGVQRVVPGVGLQAFTQPATVDPRPENFGLLVFQ